MLTSYTIIVCLSALTAPPAPTYGLDHPVTSEAHHCDRCGHRQYHQKGPIGDWLCPRCDMSQRYPYYPTNHGNYYFRPYHMQRVLEQQGQAVSWGEDPRNPYGHLVFDRVYEQLRREQAASPETLPPATVVPMIELKTGEKKPETKKEVTPPANRVAPPAAEAKEDDQAAVSRPPFKFSR